MMNFERITHSEINQAINQKNMSLKHVKGLYFHTVNKGNYFIGEIRVENFSGGNIVLVKGITDQNGYCNVTFTDNFDKFAVEKPKKKVRFGNPDRQYF